MDYRRKTISKMCMYYYADSEAHYSVLKGNNDE